MAATAWAFFNSAKKLIGQNTNGIRLDAGIPKMTLRTSAALLNTSASARIHSTLASIGGEITAQGGYTAGGQSLLNVEWTTAGDPASIKWDACDLVFCANAADLLSIKFAVIHFSTAAASGYPLCWSKLSASEFTVTTGNTLTIQFATAGIFTLT